MEECNKKVQSLAEEIKTRSVEKKSLEEKMAVLTKQLANAKVNWCDMHMSSIPYLV